MNQLSNLLRVKIIPKSETNRNEINRQKGGVQEANEEKRERKRKKKRERKKKKENNERK